MRWHKNNVAASTVIHVEQLCDQRPPCLLGMKPTLGPGIPGNNQTDAAALPHHAETQTAPLKTK